MTLVGIKLVLHLTLLVPHLSVIDCKLYASSWLELQMWVVLTFTLEVALGWNHIAREVAHGTTLLLLGQF